MSHAIIVSTSSFVLILAFARDVINVYFDSSSTSTHGYRACGRERGRKRGVLGCSVPSRLLLGGQRLELYGRPLWPKRGRNSRATRGPGEREAMTRSRRVPRRQRRVPEPAHAATRAGAQALSNTTDSATSPLPPYHNLVSQPSSPTRECLTCVRMLARTRARFDLARCFIRCPTSGIAK